MELFYSPANDEIDAFYRKAIFSLIFVLMVIGVLILGAVVRGATKHSTSGQFPVLNHVLGGMLGLLRGVFVCAALIALLDLSLERWEVGDYRHEAKLIKVISPFADYLKEWFPTDYFENNPLKSLKEDFRDLPNSDFLE